MTVVLGDCVEQMAALLPDSIDAVICDPPYALGFMGREWDSFGDTGRGSRARTERAAEVTETGKGHTSSKGAYLAVGIDSLRSAGPTYQTWTSAWATEALRVLKPGGHLLAFGGTRTYHRLACGIEDAGFEIRDCLAWMYGSGFPKSLDVSKAIDKRAGADREVVGQRDRYRDGHERRNLGDRNEVFGAGLTANGVADVTAPATPEAQTWQGWGTALKPAFEPIVLARKPLTGTVAGNVLEHGTGALNVDGCRIGTGEGGAREGEASAERRYTERGGTNFAPLPGPRGGDALGRWPSNVLLDEEAASFLDAQTGELTSGRAAAGGHRRTEPPGEGIYGGGKGLWTEEGDAGSLYGDSGGASRFFYVAKVGSAERNAGLGVQSLFSPEDAPDRNTHPTVKPIALMRWLVRLVTPPGGLVLDPFTGSGTTGIAAHLEGFRFLGIERDEDYHRLAEARIAHWKAGA